MSMGALLDHRRGYHLGLALVTASALIWSTAGLYARVIHVDTPVLLYWRGMFGCLGLLLFLVWRDGPPALTRFVKPSANGWLYALVSAAGMLCFITSLRLTSVAHVAIIYAAVPFIAGAAAWAVLGETMNTRAILASLAALAGVVVMVGLGHDGTLLGDGLALVMTFGMAAMMIISRRAHGEDMLPAAALSSLLSALAVWPVAEPLSVHGWNWLLLASFGLVNSGFALACFTLGAQRIPPAETGLIGALDAPLAPLWVWAIVGETPALATLLGGGIVLAAVTTHLAMTAREAPA